MKKKKKTNKKVKKTFSVSRLFNPHTRSNRKKISTIKKIVTLKHFYLVVAVFVLVVMAPTVGNAVRTVLDLNKHNPNSLSTSDTTTGKKTSADKDSTLNESATNTTNQQSKPVSCNDITVEAEAQLLQTTGSLLFPRYGDSKAVFDNYNNSYRAAYNTYLSTVRAHNCPVNIADKGTVQYAGPSCTAAYSNNIIVVLKNNIYSGVNFDMAEYNRWLIAGLPKNEQQLSKERQYIQNKNNARVRSYVNTANVSLSKVYCPSLNPANYYVKMF
jgi:hypothetical protein